MPNRNVHLPVAVAAGALAAAARTCEEDGTLRPFAILGGAAAASISAMWPDVFEPAVTPRHRKVAHSFVAAGSVFKVAAEVIPEWEAYWRRVAGRAKEGLNDPSRTPIERVLLLTVELLASVMVGVLVGLAAGYLSHLVLDGLSPASLPLVGLSVS